MAEPVSEDLRISLDELRRRMDAGEQFVFVDVRNPQAWGESDKKLPGALRFPVPELESRVRELPRNTPIVAYCT